MKIYVSGRLDTYGDWDKDRAEGFLFNLSEFLMDKGYSLTIGTDLKMGDILYSGALKGMYKKYGVFIDNKLNFCPFPNTLKEDEEVLWIADKYRKDIIYTNEIAVFLFGNTLDDEGNVYESSIMRLEYYICKNAYVYTLPVGATGGTSMYLWKDKLENNEFGELGKREKEYFYELGQDKKEEEKLVENIGNYVDLVRKVIS